MAYEFQRLDAVTEVTEVSDDATVLIEEDGTIKRAPKSAVGGGSKFDTVLYVDGEAGDGQTITVEGLTWEQVVEKHENGEALLIGMFYFYGEYDDYMNGASTCSYFVYRDDSQIGISGGYDGYWNADNTWNWA